MKYKGTQSNLTLGVNPNFGALPEAVDDGDDRDFNGAIGEDSAQWLL